MSYRPEIDGLRAIAVIAVMVYHINPQWLPGGFLGVDIFFVLSGYLITSIIWHEKERSGTFSYRNFYTRRIKRLMPPLWPILIFTSVSALLLFPISRFETYVYSAASSVLFVANHFFSTNHGYFNSPDHNTLLLHLWSLSVEEQFYLIWPTTLLLVHRSSVCLNTKLVILICVAIMSLLGATLMASTGRFENEAFYFLAPRAGELLLGCILALYPHSSLPKWKSPFLGVVGFLLLFAPLALYDETTLFPGFSALIPCIAVVLVLTQFSVHSFTYKTFLGNRVAIYVGKISYSLYLWHWPLLAILAYLLGNLETYYLAAILAASFLMAHLSWVYIEQPSRRTTFGFGKSLMLFVVAPACLVAIILSLRFVLLDSSTEFDKTSYNDKYAPFCYQNIERDIRNCRYGDTSKKPKAILFGDSHAGHFSPYWNELGTRYGFSIDAFSAQTCYPLLSIDDVTPHSDKSVKDKFHCPEHLKVMEKIVNNYDVIILSAGWNIYFSEPRAPKSFDFIAQLTRQLSYFENKGKKVVLMAQVPWFESGAITAYQNKMGIPSNVLRSGITSVAPKPKYITRDEVDKTNSLIKDLTKLHQNTLFVDAIDKNSKIIGPFLDGHLIYSNADHLSIEGSKLLAQKNTPKSLSDVFKWLTEN